MKSTEGSPKEVLVRKKVAVYRHSTLGLCKINFALNFGVHHFIHTKT